MSTEKKSTEKKTPVKKLIPIKKKIPRRDNPSYVLNPKTGSYIKRSGTTHRKLISDNIYDIKRELKKNTILKIGSKDELTQFKQNLDDSGLSDDGKHQLVITNGRLLRRRRKMTVEQVLNNSQNSTKQAIMANKFLLTENRLTDKQTDMILTRIIDSKIMGKDINLEKEIAIFCNLNELGIDVKKTESGSSKIPNRKPELKSILKKPNRFRLRKPPPPVMTDTEVESEYPRSGDDSDSDSDFYK